MEKGIKIIIALMAANLFCLLVVMFGGVIGRKGGPNFSTEEISGHRYIVVDGGRCIVHDAACEDSDLIRVLTKKYEPTDSDKVLIKALVKGNHPTYSYKALDTIK